MIIINIYTLLTDFYTGENFIKVIIISNIILSFQKKVYKFYFIFLYRIKWYLAYISYGKIKLNINGNNKT